MFESLNDLKEFNKKNSTKFAEKIFHSLQFVSTDVLNANLIGLIWCPNQTDFYCNPFILSQFLLLKPNSINTNFRNSGFTLIDTSLTELSKNYSFLKDERRWKRRRYCLGEFNSSSSSKSISLLEKSFQMVEMFKSSNSSPEIQAPMFKFSLKLTSDKTFENLILNSWNYLFLNVEFIHINQLIKEICKYILKDSIEFKSIETLLPSFFDNLNLITYKDFERFCSFFGLIPQISNNLLQLIDFNSDNPKFYSWFSINDFSNFSWYLTFSKFNSLFLLNNNNQKYFISFNPLINKSFQLIHPNLGLLQSNSLNDLIFNQLNLNYPEYISFIEYDFDL